jgi:hypothetical protein
MTKSIKLLSVLLILINFSTASQAEKITKCVDATGNITFTTMGCKTSETDLNAKAEAEAKKKAEADDEAAKSTKTSSSQTNPTEQSSTTAPSQNSVPEPTTESSSQPANPSGNKREKLGEGSPDSVGVGAGI